MNATHRKVARLIDCAARHAKTRQGRSAVESIELAADYAEPGYSTPESGIIAFGNWNDITHYDKGNRVVYDDTPSRLGKILSARYGVECEWCDEWSTCSECNRAIRIQPDSWSWEPSFALGDGEILCSECVHKGHGDFPEAIKLRYDGAAKGPGKFEGEADWAVYYWDRSLEGASDSTEYDPDDNTPIEIFMVSDKDWAAFPELASIAQVWLWEDDQGFVSTRTFEIGETVPEWEEPRDYEVLVGNVGSVYMGNDREEACTAYNEYCTISKQSTGARAYGETVTMLIDGEIDEQYIGHECERSDECDPTA